MNTYPLFNTFYDDARVFTAKPTEECWNSHLESVLQRLSKLFLLNFLFISRIQHKQIDADAMIFKE